MSIMAVTPSEESRVCASWRFIPTRVGTMIGRGVGVVSDKAGVVCDGNGDCELPVEAEPPAPVTAPKATITMAKPATMAPAGC
jgi:hypothetical protein